MLYFAVLLAGVAAACSKSEIPVWDAMPRVWFTNANDTTVFSFQSQPEDIDKYTVEIPISTAGSPSDVDRTVNVEDLGCTNDTSRYEIVAVIPAKQNAGVLRVTVYKTANLENAADTVGFRILPSEDFETGLNGYLENALVFTSMLSKPDWWDSDAERYIGYYSDKKMQIIMQYEGALDTFEKVASGEYSWSAGEVGVMIYKLNKYCRTNNIKYNESDEDVIQFDFWTD